MTNLTITYGMKNETETAEACVTLPIKTIIAESLAAGYQSGVGRIKLERILRDLAELQGYHIVEIKKMEI